MTGRSIRRGDVWLTELDPARGHEQGGTRPCLVISADTLNLGPAELVVVVPVTSKAKAVRSHVLMEPPEGGLSRPGFAKCEGVRSIATERLIRQMGTVSEATMQAVGLRLCLLLGL